MVLAKTKSAVSVNTAAVCKEIDKVIVRTIAFSTAVIGLWVTACLVSATYQAGGILPLCKAWFTAVSGG